MTPLGDRIAEALRANPSRNDYDLARELGCCHRTVWKYRHKLGIQPARVAGPVAIPPAVYARIAEREGYSQSAIEKRCQEFRARVLANRRQKSAKPPRWSKAEAARERRIAELLAEDAAADREAEARLVPMSPEAASLALNSALGVWRARRDAEIAAEVAHVQKLADRRKARQEKAGNE